VTVQTNIEKLEEQIFFLSHPELLPKPIDPANNSASLKVFSQKEIKTDPTINTIIGALFQVNFCTLKSKDLFNGEETSVAVKLPKTRECTDLESMKTSFNISFLSKLSHPCIETFYGITKIGKQYALVTEACKGMTLDKVLLDRNIVLTLERKINYCFQITSGILYLNEFGMELPGFSPCFVNVSIISTRYSMYKMSVDLTTPKLMNCHTCLPIKRENTKTTLSRTLCRLSDAYICILLREKCKSNTLLRTDNDLFSPNIIKSIIEKYLSPPTPTPEQEDVIEEFVEIIKYCRTAFKSSALGEELDENNALKHLVYLWSKLLSKETSQRQSKPNRNIGHKSLP